MTLLTAAGLALVAASFETGVPAQARVHSEVRAMMQADKGRVMFTDLWNGDRLNAAEREYAARLYEVFFALPAHVQDELRARGVAPSPAEIAANYGLAPEAVDLLLEVMTSERACRSSSAAIPRRARSPTWTRLPSRRS